MSGISRRAFNLGAAAAVGTLLTRRLEAAPLFKGGKVRVICGFPTGSGGDEFVRFYAARMEPLLGASVTVVNFMEENLKYEGNLATQNVLDSPADGRTIYLTAGAILTANQNLMDNPPFDVTKTLQSFGTVTRVPNTLVVRADSPYKTLAELTAAMKSKGDAAKYGVANGSVVRVIGALYRKMAGLSVAEIVRRDSHQTFKLLEDGEVDYVMSNNVYPVQLEKAGKVRILAINAQEREVGAPQYATFNEFGYPIDVDNWWAGFVPIKTPRRIVDHLGQILSAVVQTDVSRNYLSEVICDPWVQTPDQSQRHLVEQLAAWRDYVELAELEKEA